MRAPLHDGSLRVRIGRSRALCGREGQRLVFECDVRLHQGPVALDDYERRGNTLSWLGLRTENWVPRSSPAGYQIGSHVSLNLSSVSSHPWDQNGGPDVPAPE